MPPIDVVLGVIVVLVGLVFVILQGLIWLGFIKPIVIATAGGATVWDGFIALLNKGAFAAVGIVLIVVGVDLIGVQVLP